MRYPTRRFLTNPGCAMQPVYKSERLDDGMIQVFVVDQYDAQAKIDSYAESCSIDLILARCARGDYSGLQAHQGTYGDFTAMPKTLAEVMQHTIDGRAMYDALDEDIKRKFDGFEDWARSTGSAEWFDKMGVVDAQDPVPAVPEEGAQNES